LLIGLDNVLEMEQRSLGVLGQGDRSCPKPDPVADVDRRGEAHPLGSVVQRAVVIADPQQLVRQGRYQCHGQEAVRECPSARQLGRGAFGVHVIPGVIAGDRGERVDEGLIHRHPSTRAERLTDEVGDLGEVDFHEDLSCGRNGRRR
jgi:hypothetical protein